MPLRFYDDAGYAGGMNRDESSWILPPGTTYDQLNMLNDQPGMARQRGGSTALFSGAQTAFATSIGWTTHMDLAALETLYGVNGKDGGLHAIDTSAGTNLSTVAAATPVGTVGRGVRHAGFCIFPVNASAVATHGSVIVGGYNGTTTFTNTVATTVAAANPQITLAGADVTTNIKVGAIIKARDSGTTYQYLGRVVTVDSGTKFTVAPTPSRALTIGIGLLTTTPSSSETGGTCATSFQNRLLYGNTMELAASNPVRNHRRVIYSVLPTEEVAPGLSPLDGLTGAAFMFTKFWPVSNYFDVPGSDPIIALEPIDSNRLLILTASDVMIGSGELITQLATTSPSITFDIYPFDVTNGCLSDLSVHRTPAGIMWAGAEGVYAYWPPIRRSLAHTGMRNLMDGKILDYWKQLTLGANFVIHGAAYARGHYIISGSSAGVTFSLCCNLSNNAWTRLSGAGTDIFVGARRPSIPQQTFALRWWDQTGAAPSMTNGQTVRLESMMDLYTAGTTKTDADGAAVPVSISTRTIGGDVETQKMFQRGTIRYQQAASTAAMSVTGQSTIDAADINAQRTRALGSLSNTETRTVSNATNANPIVVTTSANHGYQNDDFIDIDGVTGNTHANGRWRIVVTGVTTFSLVGGIGNGAFGGSPTCKKLSETDLRMSDLNKGQGASLTIAGSPNNFELHGVRLAVLEQAPVMSA